MAIMEWKQQYSVNIKSIDEQHKKWIAIINKLDTALTSGQSDDILGPIIQEALDYTGTHFSFEEDMMLEHGYPEYHAHKQIHADFIADIQSLNDRMQGNDAGLAIDLLGTLGSWLVKHILDEDKKYSSYLNEKGVS